MKQVLKKFLSFWYLDGPINAENLFSFSVMLFAASIPLPLQFTNVATALMIVTFMFSKKRVSQIPREWIMLTIPVVYFAAHLISLLITGDLVVNSFQVEKRISFVLFPLMFFFKTEERPGLLDRILSVFFYAIILACTLCLILSTVDSLSSAEVLPEGRSYFLYEDLTRQIGLHPTYFAMYVVCAIGIALTRRDRPVLTSVLVIMLILISSRIGFVALFALLALLFFQKETIGLSTKKLLLVATVFLIVFCVSMVVSNASLQRQFSDYFSVSPAASNTGINMRLVHWQASFNVIRESIWTGYGVADAQQVLDREYRAMGYANFIGLSAHSQYLWEMICFGLPGLFGLFALLGSAILLQGRLINRLLPVLILVVSIFCLTECVLYVNKGIVFFTFFYSILLFLRKA